MNSPKLKVFIADRSPYSRLVLTTMVQDQPDLEVVETASDLEEFLKTARLFQPDVLLTDLTGLGKNERIRVLQQVRAELSVPVLGLLALEEQKSEVYLEEAELGMYACVLKPSHTLKPQLRRLEVEIIDKLRASRQLSNNLVFGKQNGTFLPVKTKNRGNLPKAFIVIGASTGGIPAIEELIAGLDPNLKPCILIAVHLPAEFTRSLAKRLQGLTRFKVVEGKLGVRLMANQIVIASGGKNMAVMPGLSPKKGLCINLQAPASNEFDLPSVNHLMESVAKFAGDPILGILLSGLGNDGTQGFKAILQAGGTTLVQDQASSVVFGMAHAAIQKGVVQHIRNLSRIPAFINQFVAALPATGQQFSLSIK